MIKTDKRYEINYIDASGAHCYQRCPARYLFSRLMALTPIGYRNANIAPDFGTCIHRALPYCYSGPSSLDAAISEFKSAWSSFNYGEDDPKRNTDRAIAMLRDFATSHAPGLCPYTIENFPVSAPTRDKVSANEIPFLIDIGGPLSAAGRIDLAVRWSSTKQLFAADYKTASEISARYFDCFKFSPQACLYTLALSQIASERAHGLIIEALRISEKNTENKSFFVLVSDHEISVAISHFNAISASILASNDSGCWPQNISNCSPYGSFGQPGRCCEYLPLCQSADWRAELRNYTAGEQFHPFLIDTTDKGEQL